MIPIFSIAARPALAWSIYCKNPNYFPSLYYDKVQLTLFLLNSKFLTFEEDKKLLYNMIQLQGIYQCGPCPVKAVKNGEVYLPYDAGFVFAEVNGDRVYWQVKRDGQMEVMVIDRRSIGKFISTKAVGSNEREDLTNEYKFPEGKGEG